MSIRIDSPGGGSVSGTATNHAVLTNLDFASAGHTDFQQNIPTGTTAQFYRGDKTWQLVPDTGAASNVAYAPTGATYIVQIANATLTNEQAIADLATGILKGTSGTGLVSIAIAGTDFEAPIATGTTAQYWRGDKTWQLVPDTGAGAGITYAPTGATYIVQIADSTLNAEQALADLNTGLLKSTSGTGLLSIASSASDYQVFIATDNAFKVYHGDKTFTSVVSSTTLSANVLDVATTITSVTIKATSLVSTTSLNAGGTITCITVISTETVSATTLSVGTTARLGGTTTSLSLISATNLTVGVSTLGGTTTALSLISATTLTVNTVTLGGTVTALSLISATSLTVGGLVTLAGTVTALSLTSGTTISASTFTGTTLNVSGTSTLATVTVTSFVAPNNTNPSLTVVGQLAIDTSTGANSQLRFYAASESALAVYQSKSFVIVSPTTASDYVVWKAPFAVSLRQYTVHCNGADNVVGALDLANGKGVTNTATSADVTAWNGSSTNATIANASIAANSYTNWHTTSISGTPLSCTVTFDYTIDTNVA